MSALKRIFHWGPLIALFIIKSITFSTLYMTSMFLPPLGSLWGCFNHIVFLSLVGCTLYNFFMAMFGGPGFVHFGWKPAKEENLKFLQYCTFCEGYKAPRAHHCRKCKRCVMKMDHHCPWINTCCGYKNHAHFTFFLFCAVCGSCHATVLLVIGLYRAFHLSWYFYYGDREHLVYLTLYPLVCTVFSLGLAIGVVIAVGGLFIIQMKIILKNETSIENWIVTKAMSRARPEKQKFIYPYNLGWWKNLQEVFPYPKGDGLTWPVVKGCSQYTLTMEQLFQKQEKKAHARQYAVIEQYSGSWFPITKGLRVCFNIPCSDEPRIPLHIGEKVAVTRWKRHWLYGERIQNSSERNSGKHQQKGWFPRKCVVEFTSIHCDVNKVQKKSQ